MNTSTLNKLPQAIADQHYKLLALDGMIRDARELISKFEAEIDAAIAFSDAFKNEAQRKAAKSQMMAEKTELVDTLEILRGLTEDRDKQSVEFNLLRDRFSIAKLEARERIAKMETFAS